jgi:hypothetical protein
LPSLARAADWSKSFPPRAVATYLDRGNAKILVAAAGKEDDGDAAWEAAEALRAALRASGRARLVMDEQSLGPVASLDDQRIVAKCGKLAVDAVAVVRVFPAAGDASASAVVTLFDKHGATLSAFSAEQGTPLPPRGTGGAGAGVSTEAAGAVSKVLRTAREDPPSEAQAEYDRKFVGLLDITGINQYGAVVGQWSQPFLGKYRRALDVAEFYDAVGEHEMAEEYRAKSRVKTALGVPGAILAVGGLIAAITAGVFWLSDAGSTCDPSFEDCAAKASKANGEAMATGVSVGALALGVGLMIGSAVVSRPTVTPDEARAMADKHNQRLRQTLGLGPEDEEREQATDETPRRAASPRLGLRPTASSHGGSLALALSF